MIIIYCIVILNKMRYMTDKKNIAQSKISNNECNKK